MILKLILCCSCLLGMYNYLLGTTRCCFTDKWLLHKMWNIVELQSTAVYITYIRYHVSATLGVYKTDKFWEIKKYDKNSSKKMWKMASAIGFLATGDVGDLNCKCVGLVWLAGWFGLVWLIWFGELCAQI